MRLEADRRNLGNRPRADKLGEQWAFDNNIPVERFPAEWNRLGKSAGYVRNQQMADNADALIALWDGVSKGTKHMIDIAKGKGLKVYIHKEDTTVIPLSEREHQLMIKLP